MSEYKNYVINSIRPESDEMYFTNRISFVIEIMEIGSLSLFFSSKSDD